MNGCRPGCCILVDPVHGTIVLLTGGLEDCIENDDDHVFSLSTRLVEPPPILVLDEAASALDSESEATIQENLAEVMTSGTVIAIGHRVSISFDIDSVDPGFAPGTGTPEVGDGGGLVVRIAPSVPGTMLNEGVTRFEVPNHAVVEFKADPTVKHDAVVERRRLVHARVFHFERLGDPGRAFRVLGSREFGLELRRHEDGARAGR